ncbi:MAG: VOC family protein [Pirellulaceae bacterium]|nr:VOC family protein [Pirellulaceae bacterium]
MNNEALKKDSIASAHLRVARPTDRLEEVQAFYCDALGFKVLGGFKDHDGFDGVMLGHEGAQYHLEFTTRAGHHEASAPSPEHLLVFYLPDLSQWQAAIERLESQGFSAVEAFNPYWDIKGRTYEDPDGNRVVIQNASWPTE